MLFSTSTTHALRALAHLAARRGNEATLGRDLARAVGIPAPYLAKLLGTLARAGVLTASRGAGGGYRLARPAGEIALLEIVEPLEGKRIRPGCLLRPGEPCSDDRACTAHAAWSDVKRVFTHFLETRTLADIQGHELPVRGTRPAHRGERAAGRGRASRMRRKVARATRREGAPSTQRV